jgi:hypothetical protein
MWHGNSSGTKEEERPQLGAVTRGMVNIQQTEETQSVCVCVCMCVRACVSVRACVRV